MRARALLYNEVTDTRRGGTKDFGPVTRILTEATPRSSMQ